MNEIIDLGLLIYLLFALKQKVTKIQKYTVVRNKLCPAEAQDAKYVELKDVS